MKDTTQDKPSENTRERILEAASALFAKNGSRGTSARMIADRARRHPAAIGDYFHGKENLRVEVVRDP